jgi:hypothetical protein
MGRVGRHALSGYYPPPKATLGERVPAHPRAYFTHLFCRFKRHMPCWLKPLVEVAPRGPNRQEPKSYPTFESQVSVQTLDTVEKEL